MAVDTDELPPLDAEHVYQLWAVHDGTVERSACSSRRRVPRWHAHPGHRGRHHRGAGRRIETADHRPDHAGEPERALTRPRRARPADRAWSAGVAQGASAARECLSGACLPTGYSALRPRSPPGPRCGRRGRRRRRRDGRRTRRAARREVGGHAPLLGRGVQRRPVGAPTARPGRRGRCARRAWPGRLSTSWGIFASMQGVPSASRNRQSRAAPRGGRRSRRGPARTASILRSASGRPRTARAGMCRPK